MSRKDTVSKLYRENKKKADHLKKNAKQAKGNVRKKIPREPRGNKRQFFKYFNSKINVRPEITSMQNENGDLVDIQ